MNIDSCDIDCLRDDAEARQLLTQLRWADGFRCPRCSCTKGYRLKRRGLIECSACRLQSSCTSNTVLHGTRSALCFIRLLARLAQGKHESAHSVTKEWNVSYPTIWKLKQKVRAMLTMHLQSGLESVSCERLKIALCKRSGEIGSPSQIGRTTVVAAPDGVVKEAIAFLLWVFHGVSRKYSQPYIAEFSLRATGSYPSLAWLLEASLLCGPLPLSVLFQYRSPPVVLIRYSRNHVVAVGA